ncbi:hypothetical protein L195_g036893 [Trifolium pratense]|uniref:Uncharacterized protein n=1 Tax=Trifolium pratense TaxID=57577 RepID=A0A2K3LQS6_TRIPR|nr:hypothetical protein L195_g036893 [Trifolium pratense]
MCSWPCMVSTVPAKPATAPPRSFVQQQSPVRTLSERRMDILKDKAEDTVQNQELETDNRHDEQDTENGYTVPQDKVSVCSDRLDDSKDVPETQVV